MAQLYGGSFEAYTNSMAAEIEEALNDLRQEKGLEALPANDPDRQMLFIAIARGVINHLKSNEAAFVIQFDVDTSSGTIVQVTTQPDIDVREP
jgi:hypothetical protein